MFVVWTVYASLSVTPPIPLILLPLLTDMERTVSSQDYCTMCPFLELSSRRVELKALTANQFRILE
jgi:hypothetical protein